MDNATVEHYGPNIMVHAMKTTTKFHIGLNIVKQTLRTAGTNRAN